VAYQYVGTNLIAQREVHIEAGGLRAQWVPGFVPFIKRSVGFGHLVRTERK
jgi:hypothetical protein